MLSRQLLERAVKRLSVAAKPSPQKKKSAPSSLDSIFDSVLSRCSSDDVVASPKSNGASTPKKSQTPTASTTKSDEASTTSTKSAVTAPKTMPELPEDIKLEVKKIIAVRLSSSCSLFVYWLWVTDFLSFIKLA